MGEHMTTPNIYGVADGNYVLGAGHMLFQPENQTYWEKLGESAEVSLATEAEEVILESVDSPTGEELARVVSNVNRVMTCSLRDITQRAIELFLAASTSETSQGSAAGVTDTFNGIEADQYYQLGEGGSSPPAGAAGFRKVSVNSVTGSTSGALTEGTDYEVDADLGLVRILKDAGITPGENITVDFDHAAVDYDATKSGSAASLKGALKFVSHNTNGKDYVIEVREASIAADGDLLLKSRDTFMEVPLTIAIIQPSGNDPAIELVFRAEVE